MPDLPVDLAQLASQTGNDVKLEREVLRLYMDHAPADFALLRAAATAEERRMGAHRMVGSARAIGAGEVARLAAAVEQRQNAPGETITALGKALDAAGDFIKAHLASSPAAR